MEQVDIHGVVDAIALLNNKISTFWRNSYGWAPAEAAELLGRSRLDRQVALSHTLRLWVEPEAKEGAPDLEGRLILGWANLGALVEGSLSWYLCVYYDDFKKSLPDKKPDDKMLADLNDFYRDHVSETWWDWIDKVRKRRNAIHAFTDRAVGSLNELEVDVRQYLYFLKELDESVPYPDEMTR
jgi:hypothetical protein